MLGDPIAIIAAKLDCCCRLSTWRARSRPGSRSGSSRSAQPSSKTVLSRHINDLEPRLTRKGYDVRQLLRGKLNPDRIRELRTNCRPDPSQELYHGA